MAIQRTARQAIQSHQDAVGPRQHKPRNVRITKLSDYPRVPQPYLEVAQKLSSPLLMGPPICDELVAFVQHLFTEEEAGVVRHLGAMVGRTAEDLARAEHLSLDQIEPILRRLAAEKRCIAATGPDDRKKFRLMPVMPGIFEMVLISERADTISPWHRRFAELFEALYETGYVLDYQQGQKGPAPVTRVLTVGRAIEAHPMALPSDRLDVILDRFTVFGVGNCQCRTTEQVVGRGCDKPVFNCTVMGQFAEEAIAHGAVRKVSKQELLEIKREAESHGLVNWIMNVESARGQVSCSCCGCCCHAMRMVNAFNAPGVLLPAHFVPQLDSAQCSFCGKCVRICPMGALAVDAAAKTYDRRAERCIGCGLCAVACEQRKAIRMEPVPDYKLPYRSWFSFLFHSAPAMAKGVWGAWKRR